MKFRGHETFFVRKGWISKGLKHVSENGRVFTSKDENPMDALGLGANMVKSLRWWLQALGLTEEFVDKGTRARAQKLTALGELVYTNDRYVEESGTLALLHWSLASNEENATSWYFFFNEFSMVEFTKEDFVTALQSHIKMKNDDGARDVGTERTLGDDFACMMGAYIPRAALSPRSVSPENDIDCPLGELRLASLADRRRGIYRKTLADKRALDPWALLAIITARANASEKSKTEIPFDELLRAPRNIGRTFNLDSMAMLDALREIEKTGEIKIIRAGGLDVVRRTRAELTFIDCAKKFYENAGGAK